MTEIVPARALTAGEWEFLRALGKQVRLARVTVDWSQQRLAEASGMSRNFVSSIERGAHGVDVVRLLRLATALEVPLFDLLQRAMEAAARAAERSAADGTAVGVEAVSAGGGVPVQLSA
jgi:transcriptional regulator with XRE-family HTH domain